MVTSEPPPSVLVKGFGLYCSVGGGGSHTPLNKPEGGETILIGWIN